MAHKVFICFIHRWDFLFVALSVFFFPFISFSQGKQANSWYFGAHAGLNYNTGSPPSALPDGQTWAPAGAGSASISDENGYLLFYSDGETIWNKLHNVMLNGQDMGSLSTQGAIIVPSSGNTNLFYFFNFVWDPGSMTYNLQYSLIDMNLDNGLGGVIPLYKSIRLLDNTTSHLSAVFHKYGEDIWVVTHGYENNNYYSFLITPSGLTLIPIVSTGGTICDSHNGYMKISPNGKKIAVSQMFSPSLGSFFDVVDFDNMTGVVSDANLVHSSPGTFGLEFSPDNSKLYTNFGFQNFYQYNLNAGSPQQILDSRFQLVSTNIGNGALQLGPDGKIICATDRHTVGIIHNPNDLGSACNYEHEAIDMANGTLCYENLPSFIQSYLNDPEFTTTQNCFGQPTQFTITTTNGIDSVKWKFKDFGNMPNDTSTQLSPAYTFSGPGTY
ncbi:MAG TPA: hypothetical protein DCL86_07180, partial [Bacteroidales bacterium]|nr:hypothetical protein [Bacteroidales bacterium]